MKISELELKNFRNIADQRFSFVPGPNILAGNNAQGKTNCMEAVYFCTCLKSYRVIREEQLIRNNEETASVTLDFETNGKKEQIQILFRRNQPKEYRYNGLVVTRLRDLLGCFQSVLFTPDHLNLIKEGPNRRRSFLDMALCTLDLQYTDQLLAYQKILKNRNVLLRRCANRPEEAETLDVWDEKLAESGSYIAAARQNYLLDCDGLVKEYYADISRSDEKMKLIYLNQFTKDPASREDFARMMLERLRRGRETDLEMGQTMTGVHKDDILALLSGRTMKFYASQGQIRSAVLSLKLAEAEMIRRKTGDDPVLLLDDILSELDSGRQKYVFQRMNGQQAIITTCELGKIRKKGDAVFFMKEGKVVRSRVSAPGSGRIGP